ncbi:MAG: hypothetical protein OEW78_05535 [Nitrosopumilus sp.]|uniref:hypothetical protein n=1 Tax=Nitrosopumilus sp. TaxID=2024843 RepID=UPI0024718E66|nr:hypothetical protein [Nitrosopumilus sp.]MDH5431329.1 hypothetical protein [Nitrosopumilus sp.]MDH5665822.1 hypothetical protein [Nitrosopumilus sp.]MDH5698204.1 hypothetical protein [Nitrosopumilus sp.]
MKKRGLIIATVGLVLVAISLTIAVSTVPSNITDPNDLSMASLFEGMFDQITSEIQIMPGELTYVTYDVSSYDASLLWGVQIIDYNSGDALLIKISNIFGDDYGEFVMFEPILFKALEITLSDSLNFEIKNTGPNPVNVILMISEYNENSDALSNPDSPVMNMIVPLLISGFLLVLGIIVAIISVIIILVDVKNNLDDKRNY